MSNNTSPTSEEIFNFPCDYPVKVFGKKCQELEKEALQIISKHSGDIHPKSVIKKESSKGSYLSITVRIVATSREQLDKINSELQAHHLVAYIL
jgi:putative lipoic acid-binding regulatory protein